MFPLARFSDSKILQHHIYLFFIVVVVFSGVTDHIYE